MLKDLKTKPILDEVLKCKNNLIQHSGGIKSNRLSRVLKRYKPRGLKTRRRHLKR